MKLYPRLGVILAAVALLLLLAFSNCGQVIFDAVKVGNPGDPPPADPTRIQAVKNFITSICVQQIRKGLVTDRAECETHATNDSVLAEKIYLGPIDFGTLLSAVGNLKSLNTIASQQCISEVESSPLALGVPSSYSAVTARAIVDSLASCQSFFIQSEAPSLACLEEGPEQNGSENLPWQISDCQCLQNIESLPNDSQKSDVFSLSADLNCEGFSFSPISNLTGTLNGNGRTIRNLTIEGPSASVFVGELKVLKNLRFESLTLRATAANGTATLHFNSIGTFPNTSVFSNIQIVSSTYVAPMPDGFGYGFTNSLVGVISDSSFQGNIYAGTSAGLAGQMRSLRTEVTAERQRSAILNSLFRGGITAKAMLAGITLSNKGGLISNSWVEAFFNLNQTWGDTDFQIGGIAAINTMGGEILDCTVSGYANLSYVVLSNPHTSYQMEFGTVAALNGVLAVGVPPYSTSPGVIRNCRSSMSYRASIRKNGFDVNVLVGDIFGSDDNGVGISEGNIFSGVAERDIL